MLYIDGYNELKDLHNRNFQVVQVFLQFNFPLAWINVVK